MQNTRGLGHNRGSRPTSAPMYAISFDLDAKVLEQNYPNSSWQTAYADIGRLFVERGFDRQQGSVCFGDHTVDVVRCQLVSVLRCA